MTSRFLGKNSDLKFRGICSVYLFYNQKFILPKKVHWLYFDSEQVIFNRVTENKKLSKFRNTQIGFIFQFHELLPEFTAIENVIIPAIIKGEKKDVSLKKAKTLLETLGLLSVINQFPSQLSGGEQQRVAVARALINDPKVIFADEPSGNLDSKSSDLLHKLFFDLREKLNITFIIVTHNKELSNMTDRKLNLVDGKWA